MLIVKKKFLEFYFIILIFFYIYFKILILKLINFISKIIFQNVKITPSYPGEKFFEFDSK